MGLVDEVQSVEKDETLEESQRYTKELSQHGK